jgi:hypothetical protein
MNCQCVCGCQQRFRIDYSLGEEPICIRCKCGAHNGRKLEDEE